MSGGVREPAGQPERQAARLAAASLALGGLVVIGVAIYLGASVAPALYLLALLGIADLVVAWALSSGRIGPLARRAREARTAGDAARIAELDPSFNPYARED